MLSPQELENIHWQLNNLPDSLSNLQKRRTRHLLRKKLKEHRYATNYPPFQPSPYELIFVNRNTSSQTLIKLDHAIQQSNTFTLDTESFNTLHQPNQPALIQLQIICSEIFSIIMLIEVHHLPRHRQHEFLLIQNLFQSLFQPEKKIFVWGDIQELSAFTRFSLFTTDQILLSENINAQKHFRLFWERTYSHQANPGIESCRCKSCFGIEHDNALSIQDAAAFILEQYLNKTLTCQSFEIGLDYTLRQLNSNELEYRKSMSTYAAHDCDAIYQIIVKTHIIDEYLQISEESTNMNEPYLLISSTTTTFNNTIVNVTNKLSTYISQEEERLLLEPISSDDEDIIANAEVEPLPQAIDQPIEELELELEPIPQAIDQPVEEIALEPTSPEHELSAAPVNEQRIFNPLSVEERKRIHNRSCTLHQRKRAYRHEIIIRTIDRRFSIKMIKEILRTNGILFNLINTTTDKHTNATSLFIGIKEPAKLNEYKQQTKNWFNTAHYRQIRRNKLRRPFRTNESNRVEHYRNIHKSTYGSSVRHGQHHHGQHRRGAFK